MEAHVAASGLSAGTNGYAQSKPVLKSAFKVPNDCRFLRLSLRLMTRNVRRRNGHGVILRRSRARWQAHFFGSYFTCGDQRGAGSAQHSAIVRTDRRSQSILD